MKKISECWKMAVFRQNFEYLAKRWNEGAWSEQSLELHELREQRAYSIPKTYTLLTGAGKVPELARTSTKLETMKKTLIALLALSSLAMAAGETSVTFTQATNNDQAGYNGFHFILDSSWLTASPEVYEGTVFELERVSVTSAATWYNLAQKASGLVILEGNSFVGKSSWLSSGANYTFDNVQLDVNTEYTALFYGNETAFNALTLGSTVNPAQAGGQNPTEDAPVVTAGMKLDYNAGRTAGGVMINTSGALDVRAFPVVQFSGKVSNVPEPATGTMSLLALAGLCIRRRK